ncbi:MAG: hypothetical protein ACR2FY_05325 [Pirellulaceae bacterium]
MAARIGLRAFGMLMAVALWLGATGCGSSNPGPTLKVTPVKGKVTMGGEPLADVAVTLTIQGQPPKDFLGAGATTDAQGNFEISTGYQKGAPAGTYKVTVSKVVGPDGKPIVNDAATGQMADPNSIIELIPPAFNDPEQSTIELTITEGTAVPDLDIEIPKS